MGGCDWDQLIMEREYCRQGWLAPGPGSEEGMGQAKEGHRGCSDIGGRQEGPDTAT